MGTQNNDEEELFTYTEYGVINENTYTQDLEITENRNAILYESDTAKLLSGFTYFDERNDLTYPQFYGDGKAAKLICKMIVMAFKHENIRT